jgi:hypothetical protein
MASAQYLQAMRDTRAMQMQRVQETMAKQRALKSSMMMSSTIPSERLMEAQPDRELMGEQLGKLKAKKAAQLSLAKSGLVAAGTLAANYVSNIGALTGNKAAENATKNTLAKGGYAIATGGAAFKLGVKGFVAAGPLGAAVAAAGALALSALLLATENEKMIMRIQGNSAQASKDQQRLGYISYSRGR